MAIPILQTKLYIPPIRAELVARPRLTERLQASLSGKVTLVSASAGFGKTTLVSELVGRQQGPQTRVAWISLDEQDNDLVRFWSYVIAALEMVQSGVGAPALALLQGTRPAPIEEVLTTLINRLLTISTPFSLVFDDYHVITQSPLHEAMIFLLDHLPQQMHLIIISRTEPPLALNRLRVRNQLTELRESDLRFTDSEAATFLNQTMGLNLSPQDVLALEARTEGWIAGLQLAALSMQGRADIQGFVEAFTGSHRYVIDYLAEEVLATQAPHIQTFLLHTAILDRLSRSLCDTLLTDVSSEIEATLDQPSTASSQSQQILEYLEQANLFIIPLDDERHWYRYHHLFADFLREHLQKSVEPDELITLHQRASRWYAQHEFVPEAIHHALIAQDFDMAERLIETVSLDMLTGGEVMTILNWSDLLPSQVVKSSPRLSLNVAWANLILNFAAEIEPALLDAERILPDFNKSDTEAICYQDGSTLSLWAEAMAVRSIILANQNKIQEAIDLSERTLRRMSKTDSLSRSVLLGNIGAGYSQLGVFDKATAALEEAISLAEESGTLIIILTASNTLALIKIDQGELNQALRIYRRTQDFITSYDVKQQQPGHHAFLAARMYLGLAEILREQNELTTAFEYVNLGLDSNQQGSDVMGGSKVGQIVLASILHDQGRLSEALEIMRQVNLDIDNHSPVQAWGLALQARFHLATGNLPEAIQWAESCDLPIGDELRYGDYPGEYTTLVRVYIADERFDEALALLTRMEAIDQQWQRRGRLLEIFILRALTLQAMGNVEQALPWLKQALPIAKTGGYIRLFVNEGPPMKTLLTLIKSQGQFTKYIDHILGAFTSINQPAQIETRANPSTPLMASNTPSDELIEALSDRELEVLSLIVAGLSNQEIAESLVIAEGTVKKHIHNIFGKLNVRRRSQAILRAKELSLL
ncbi:MAG: LuxR C-terminal-related transcriptional regulator [Chloroflexota bacterium]